MSQLKLSPADEPKVRDLLVRVWVRDISADDGWNELETMLAAAPQPPFGEPWEVLAYLVKDARDGQFSAHRRDPRNWAHGYPVTELVDRAHVTGRDQQIAALQARVAELEAALRSLRGVAHTKGGITLDYTIDEALAQQVTK